MISEIIVKIISCICLTIVTGMWISTCNISAEAINACKSACSTYNSQMESVTPRECVCAKNDIDDVWVLPRR